MKTAKLQDMVKGWFVGNFEPSLYKSGDVEVAVKHYRAGDSEEAHYHKIATEITVIVSGDVRMKGGYYTAGDIVIMEPGDITDFEALTDTTNVVVKLPGVCNDKYIAKSAESTGNNSQES